MSMSNQAHAAKRAVGTKPDKPKLISREVMSAAQEPSHVTLAEIRKAVLIVREKTLNRKRRVSTKPQRETLAVKIK